MLITESKPDEFTQELNAQSQQPPVETKVFASAGFEDDEPEF
jgi:hypothetical protein